MVYTYAGAGALVVLAEQEYPESIWSLVIKGLAEDGSWGSIRILLMGTDDLAALVMSFDASGLPLSGLLQSCRESSWRDWGQKLAMLLIRRGADHRTLCPMSKYPLHIALRIGLKAGKLRCPL